MIDRVENNLTDKASTIFDAHIGDCPACQKEYNELQILYDDLHEDIVPLPDEGYWETVRQRVREKAVCLGTSRSWVRKLVPVALPVFVAGCIALIVLVRRPSETLEMTVPIEEMLEDEEIAAITLQAMSFKDLIEDFTVIEESLPLDIEEACSDMTADEKEYFIELITKSNGIGS
jgi:anti-sigma factor RsiW